MILTIEVSTAIIISVLSLAFSVFMGLKSNKRTDTKDIEERVKENTRINMKLDAISSNTTDIKNEVSEMRKEINSHDNRIVKVEESVKSAHHRIDGLEERMNDQKEV
jgi:peptidoglycan hydrolase CwlO-like protein